MIRITVDRKSDHTDRLETILDIYTERKEQYEELADMQVRSAINKYSRQIDEDALLKDLNKTLREIVALLDNTKEEKEELMEMKNLNTGQVRSLISEAYSNWKNTEAQKALSELKENTNHIEELERALEAGKAVEDAGGWRAGNELIKEFHDAVDAFVAADKNEIANTTAILHTMIDEASEHDNIEAQNALIDVIHELDDPSTLLAAIEKWDDVIEFGRWRMSEDDVAEYHELLTKHVREVM